MCKNTNATSVYGSRNNCCVYNNSSRLLIPPPNENNGDKISSKSSNNNNRRHSFTTQCKSLYEIALLVVGGLVVFSTTFVATLAIVVGGWRGWDQGKDATSINSFNLRGNAGVSVSGSGTGNVTNGSGSVNNSKGNTNSHNSHHSSSSSRPNNNKNFHFLRDWGHPYEDHWYSSTIPSWATRRHHSDLTNDNNPGGFDPYRVPQEKQVCLVHIGETAGDFVGCVIGFDLNCEKFGIRSSSRSAGDGSGGSRGSGSALGVYAKSYQTHDVINDNNNDDDDDDDGNNSTDIEARRKEHTTTKKKSTTTFAIITKAATAPAATPEVLLPKYTTNLFHSTVYDCHDDSSYFLFVVLNPLERIRRAFVADKPGESWDEWTMFEEGLAEPYKQYFHFRKRLYWDCGFETLEDMVRQGLMKPLKKPHDDEIDGGGGDGGDGASASSVSTTEECQRRARESILGTEHYGTQSYYNYQYHWEGLPQRVRDDEEGKILTIRTEHIVEDWNSIEVELGGSDQEDIMGTPSEPFEMLRGYFNQGHNNADPYSYYSNHFINRLSDESRMLLCEHLCNEIQIYKRILARSINLTREQYLQSLEELKKSCPKEAAMDATMMYASSCPLPIPDIRQKLMTSRGYGDHDGEMNVGTELNLTSPQLLDNPIPVVATYHAYNYDDSSHAVASVYEANWPSWLPRRYDAIDDLSDARGSYNILTWKDETLYLKDVPREKRVCLVDGLMMGTDLGQSDEGLGGGRAAIDAGMQVGCALRFLKSCSKNGKAHYTPGFLPHYATRRVRLFCASFFGLSQLCSLYCLSQEHGLVFS